MRSLVVLSVLLALLLEFLLPSWLLAPRRVDRASAWYMARTSRAVNRPSTRQGISFMTALYSHRLIVRITSGVSQEVWWMEAVGRRQEAGGRRQEAGGRRQEVTWKVLLKEAISSPSSSMTSVVGTALWVVESRSWKLREIWPLLSSNRGMSRPARQEEENS